jgi:hypothetical protein
MTEHYPPQNPRHDERYQMADPPSIPPGQWHSGNANVPPTAPPTAPKKSRRWLPWVAYPVVFIVGVAIGAADGGTATTSASAPGPTVTVTQEPAPAETTQPPATTAPPKPAATKAPAPKWVHLATVRGAADKNSGTITTTGGNVRIRYTFRGDGVGAIYFLDEGTDLQEDGGFPVTGMVMEATSDSIELRKAAGKYYVHVTSTMRFSVIVEEMR